MERYRCAAKAALLVALAAVMGCSSSSDGGSGTTGRAVALKTKLEIKDDLRQPKTNALGWSVTLSKAYLSVGALYYYSGDPVLSQRLPVRSSARDALAWFGNLFVTTAYAHPGHYIEGAAIGQMLVPTTVDLLGGSIELADGNGVTGVANSAKFTWQSPAMGTLASALEGHVILTQGSAIKGDITVQFIAKADAAEVIDGDKRVEVAGCALGATPGDVGVEMDDDGTVTLTLVPSVWFDQVDFGYVVTGTAGAPTPDVNGIVDLAGTLAWQGFIRGVKKGTAYEFSFQK